jgi:hypothetical protein
MDKANQDSSVWWEYPILLFYAVAFVAVLGIGFLLGLVMDMKSDKD